MVATEGIEAELKGWGVGRIMRWKRGVDTDLFCPRDKAFLDHLPRPVSLYVGRVSAEKNIEAFLSLDLLVFPSRTDTFGLVLLEALASGIPAAAYPVSGPKDVLGDAAAGVMDEDLERAARAFALTRSWEASAEQFLSNLAPFDPAQAFPKTIGTV